MGQAAADNRQRPATLGVSRDLADLRQYRPQVVVVAGVLALVAILLAVTGTHLVNVSDAYLVSCATRQELRFDHQPRLEHGRQTSKMESLTLLLIAPPLIGFLGVPLVAVNWRPTIGWVGPIRHTPRWLV